jgi:S1-C subfamily serine protease
MKRSITEIVLTSAVVLCVTAGAAAQTPFPAPEPGHGQGKNTPQPPAPRPTVAPIVSESRTVAPQVVTIVHRLNGIKFLRLLQRASGDKKTVAALNNAFGIDEEVHTNILAGLALDDGRTIATWLPQAAAELEASFYFPMMAMPPLPGNPIPGTGAATPSIPGIAPIPPGASHLTVFGRDGKELRARYVGLDGKTGISVLRISGLAFAIPNVETEKAVVLGQKLRLFAPQGATATATAAAGKVYVRVGESDATVAKIQQLDSGSVQRLVARAANLSPEVVGGIAIDDAGLTVGIIESVSGMEASIIPLSTIRQAAKRVIERQASVPRPFLGIRGEGIGFVPREQLLSNGWTVPAATALLDKRQGIMLTAVVPGTPAALAQLHPGDVILSINEKDIKSAQDFSALLGQCETSVPVKFWVARPSLANPQAVTVNLVDALNFKHNMEFWFPEALAVQAAKGRITKAVTRDPLVGLGIETIAVDSRAAVRLRAQGGLVVVAVDPGGAGYRSGVREGDVIETIDNRISTQRGSGSGAPLVSSQRIVLGVVRNGQRTHITIQKNEQKHEQIKEQKND